MKIRLKNKQNKNGQLSFIQVNGFSLTFGRVDGFILEQVPLILSNYF